MPLKIEVNSTQANVAVGKLNLKFDDLFVKINNIKKAFDSINLRKFSTAKDEILKLQKALESSNKSITILEKQNKSLSTQIELVTKSKKAVEQLTKVKKEGEKSTELLTDKEKEFAKIEQQAAEATAKFVIMTKDKIVEVRKAYTAIEKAKIVTKNMSVVQAETARNSDIYTAALSNQTHKIKAVEQSHEQAIKSIRSYEIAEHKKSLAILESIKLGKQSVLADIKSIKIMGEKQRARSKAKQIADQLVKVNTELNSIIALGTRQRELSAARELEDKVNADKLLKVKLRQIITEKQLQMTELKSIKIMGEKQRARSKAKQIADQLVKVNTELNSIIALGTRQRALSAARELEAKAAANELVKARVRVLAVERQTIASEILAIKIMGEKQRAIRKAKQISEQLLVTNKKLLVTNEKLAGATTVTTSAELKEANALKRVTEETKKATTAKKEFNRSMSAGNKHAAEFRAALSAMGISFGIFTGSTIVAAAAVYGTVKAIRSTIEAGAEFEFTMDRVNAVMNTTGAEGGALEEKVRSLAETTIFTAGEVSKGLVFLGMAGFNTAEAMQALEPTLRLAQIGMIDMERAADLVTNIMAGFDIKAHDVSATVDKLSVVVTSSNVSITQLAQSLSLVGPAAANTNTTLEETTAIIGFFGNVGIKATRAGTALRRGIANLANPTDKVGAVMNKLNVTISDSDGRMRSMVGIMTDMSKAGATMSDIFEVFGVRAGPAFASAIISGTDGIKELVAAQRTATGTSEALASVLADNAYTDFKLVISAAHEVLISFYENIDGPLRNGLNGLKNLFQTLAPLMSGFGTLLVTAATAATALGAALLLMRLGTFVTGLTVASTAVGFMGNTMVGTTGFTNLLTAAMIRLKLVMAFFNPILTVITVALTALGLAYIYSETEAEKLTDTLKKQHKVMEDLDKLRMSAGLEKYGEGAGELDKALQTLQNLKDGEGPTIGDQLADSLNSTSEMTVDLNKKLKALKKDLIVNSDEFSTVESVSELEQQIKSTEELIKSNRIKGNIVTATEKEFQRIGKLLNIENVLTLTATQLHKKVITQKRLESVLQGEITREQNEAIAAAKKENVILEAREGLHTAIKGSREDQIKLDEKSRKEALKPLFQDLKDGVGDQDKIVSEILSVLNRRQLEINKVTSEANTLKDAYKGSVDAFQKGARQVDQLATSIVTEDLEVIREKFARITALKLQQNKDLSKLDQTQLENGVQAAQKAHDRGMTAIKILNTKALDEVKSQTSREQDELDFRFSLRLVKLKDYADQTVVINNRIIQENINGLERQKAAENARLITLSNLKVSLGEQGFKTQFLNSMIVTQTEVVAKLNTGIITLTNTLQGSADATDITLSSLRGWVVEGTKANAKLEQQLNLLQLGASATKDMTQQMYQKAIADAIAAQTTGIHSEAMKELLTTLQSLSSAYDLNKAKINDLEEAWDDTTLNMKGQAKRAAESMHSAFVTFFTDPSKDALDDLLKHFAMTIQKMLAEKMAAQLFSTDGGGMGNWMTQLFSFGSAIASSGNTSGLLGSTAAGYSDSYMSNWGGNNATGGSFRVQGSRGIDSELVQFRATPGERVTVSNPNGGDDRKAERGGSSNTFNNTVIIEGNSSNKEEVRAMVDSSLNALEAKMIRQQQRTQRPMGIR